MGLDLTKIKEPTESDLEFSNATIFNEVNDEVPIKEGEVLTLFGTVSKDEYLNQIKEVTIYDRVLQLLSECTTNKYLTYCGNKVVGVSTVSETLIPEKSDFYNRNEYSAGTGLSRLIEYYTNTKVMLCIERNGDREWIAAPPTLIGFSVVEYIEKPIYR